MADSKEEHDEVENPEIHFEPLVQLDKVDIKSMEEDEDEVFKIRAKLFRFDNTVEPAEWKERGTGDVKLLKHKQTGLIRILMRRDKTLKICANHYLSPHMQLKPNCGSDRAWVWSTPCDYSDEEPRPELLAIRLANAENAQKFKASFEESQAINEKLGKSTDAAPESDQKKSSPSAKPESKDSETDTVAEKLGELSVKTDKTSEDNTKPECDQSETCSNSADKPTETVTNENTETKTES
ncbi:ran-specific GTPase-activating protein-like [Mizuhopecten yessoensis]|uniref:Ran-specific GTPase-activating protein n=1 Tax=Mizuhopecten yessoensis TaxID=6573 RepID=A0A210Q6H5_MIZYE|nr:ran-specific GTPase-activating protein-like [Mizuhopecten yessoensis]OWF44342.1 Ran-specific GTPase-activating protein [Mizuhopecten yessoensis]